MSEFIGRDRDICKMLGTNASELEKLLGKSRQTISKRMDRDELFGIHEVIEVAKKKFPNGHEQKEVVSKAIKKYFPYIFDYAQDLDPDRFSQYYVIGMDIYAEIISNEPLERFLTGLLNDMRKFLLFACAPVKPYVQLGNWLKGFQDASERSQASFILVPCKLTELTPVQILADPWSNDPQLIQYNRQQVFVDVDNASRARKIAAALREYGPAAREFASLVPEDRRIRQAADKLSAQLNRSVFQEVDLPGAVVSINPDW